MGFSPRGVVLGRAISKAMIARKPMPIEARRGADERRQISANGDIGLTSGTRHLGLRRDNKAMMQHARVVAGDRDALAPTIRRVTLRLGLLYWTATFLTDSIVWGIAGVDPLESAGGKLFACTAGLLMCFAISAVLYRARDAAVAIKALICFGAALIAAPLFALLDFGIYAFCVWPEPAHFVWVDFGKTLVSCTANFFGWSCLFVALLYHFQSREQEKRLAASREEALAAQMRALRYQINPHFLFNTLNSIASLIEEGEAKRAERMVLALSDFLHETLRLDPSHDVRLGDELALQQGYLEIERERFPSRLRVEIAVPDALRACLVPSLILQPLVENAVKHGVSAGPGSVDVRIGAERQEGQLHLWVENGVPKERRDAPGMGIGLRNVAERIEARFAGEGSFVAFPIPPDRFLASLSMPVRFA